MLTKQEAVSLRLLEIVTHRPIWPISNQPYDTLNGMFLLDITDHYPIFTIVPINYPQRRIRVKYRDHSGQNIARLKLEVKQYVNTHV